MEHKKITHFIYVPFTGLGLYNGYRGDRWLKNRITVFKQFVLPSIKGLWKDNMVLWVSWRPEERYHPQVIELENYIRENIVQRVVFTYHGVCFWDDKYLDDEASGRLLHSLNETLPILSKFCQGKKVWMTIQPSDDVYAEFPKGNTGWAKGYIWNYVTGEIAEYDPTTTPPFYTIEFDKNTFLSPTGHYKYTGPYKSHEYVKNYIPMKYLDERKFFVGVHGENISTGWDIPFKGNPVRAEIGLPKLKISRGWRRTLFFKLPHRVRRKLRYYVGERFYAKIHKYVTNH